MFMRLFDLDYPVWEKKKASWSRFEVIYKLSAELVRGYEIVPERGRCLDECWKKVALFWHCHAKTWGNINLMFEALYHICFRKFSNRVSNPLLMRLILLIEDELITFSFAFKVWSQLEVFQDAYNDITAPYWWNETFKKHYDTELYSYLMYRTVKLVMFKGLEYDKWSRLFPANINLYPLRPYDLNMNVDRYEEAVTFLIPAANTWCEEWADRSVLVTSIKQLYGVDFSDDTKGLYSLINATKHRADVDTCMLHLYRTKNCTMNLVQHLWGADYVQKFQRGFLSLCKRYKNAKRRRTVRGRYQHADFLNHWICKQIDIWRHGNTVELSDEVRKKYFDVAIGI